MSQLEDEEICLAREMKAKESLQVDRIIGWRFPKIAASLGSLQMKSKGGREKSAPHLLTSMLLHQPCASMKGSVEVGAKLGPISRICAQEMEQKRRNIWRHWIKERKSNGRHLSLNSYPRNLSLQTATLFPSQFELPAEYFFLSSFCFGARNRNGPEGLFSVPLPSHWESMQFRYSTHTRGKP